MFFDLIDVSKDTRVGGAHSPKSTQLARNSGAYRDENHDQ